MTDKATSPLRRRLIEDMAIRHFSPKTSTSISFRENGLTG